MLKSKSAMVTFRRSTIDDIITISSLSQSSLYSIKTFVRETLYTHTSGCIYTRGILYAVCLVMGMSSVRRERKRQYVS